MSQGAPSCSLSMSFPFPPSKRQARSQIQIWVRCKLFFCSENLHLRVCLSFWVLYSKISLGLQSLLMMHIAKHGFISLGLVYRFWIDVPQKVSSISYHIICLHTFQCLYQYNPFWEPYYGIIFPMVSFPEKMKSQSLDCIKTAFLSSSMKKPQCYHWV